MSDEASDKRRELARLEDRIARTLDHVRAEAAEKRHAKGMRTARENLADLVDAGSLLEYGQLAVAAQRSRRDYEELQSATAADGVITGIGTVNAAHFPIERARTAVAIYDYAVLAGTQGYFHHHKLDRLFELRRSRCAKARPSEAAARLSSAPCTSMNGGACSWICATGEARSHSAGFCSGLSCSTRSLRKRITSSRFLCCS